MAAEAKALDPEIIRNLLGEWEEVTAARQNYDNYLSARGIGWISRKLAALLSMYHTISGTDKKLLFCTKVGP